jgi:hypothetical protein
MIPPKRYAPHTVYIPDTRANPDLNPQSNQKAHAALRIKYKLDLDSRTWPSESHADER